MKNTWRINHIQIIIISQYTCKLAIYNEYQDSRESSVNGCSSAIWKCCHLSHIQVNCCTMLLLMIRMTFCSVFCDNESVVAEIDCPWWRAVCSLTSCSSLTQTSYEVDTCPAIIHLTTAELYENCRWLASELY